MNIAVCVKQTADTESQPILSSDQSRMIDDGLVWIINPHDESAIEVAIQLRDEHGGAITLFALGPDRVESALRQGLAMGADEAIHLRCDSMPDDQKIVADLLSDSLRSHDFDLILAGEMAIDGAGAQVPQRLGVLLDWPSITGVEELNITQNQLTARQPVEQGDRIHVCQLPVVIGINRRIMEPRYPSFKGIMKAKRKTIHVENVVLDSSQLNIESLELSKSRSGGEILTYEEGVAGKVISLMREHTNVI
ncbi:MAG: electron transfer flavoprotein subunit beta/FixA family protein [Bacteroidetes bacterium]|nr:electron transfer flavoprotein subunit beta/FixA family protein [Bacteroidota bacterium]MCY4205405.1 electron transfer flavoprotein subunit beta/FixA family protein [Bacteroidota bacterium]